MFNNSFPGSARLAGLALSFLVFTAQAVPPFVTMPQDGEELDDEFRVVFTQSMQETISIEFSGIGDAEIDCGWFVLFEGQPLQILDCEVTSGQLPAGSTVTWTINPGGTGMTTLGGTVIPESTGTFTTPGGGTGVEISVEPANGAVYEPNSDGPVPFTFNVAMDQSVAARDAVSFDLGMWDIIWVGNTSIQCTASGELELGFYQYTVSGLTSHDGSEAPVLTGGFLVESDPGGGDIRFFPNPPDGGTLMQFPGVPTEVAFVFSEPMDSSVDLAGAVTFSQGDWNCTWTEILPGFPVTGMGCKPTGVLPGGVYEYTLSGLKTVTGESAPDFNGSFTVEGDGTGGEITDGNPAPDCDPDGTTLSFPKSLYVCGPDLFSWNTASSFPGFGGGFLVAGAADVTGGTQSSILMLDDAGTQIGDVLATDIGVRLDAWPQQRKILATQGGTLVQPDVSIGLFDLSGSAITADFQHKIAGAGDDVSASFLPDGRVDLLRGANEEIDLIVFNANGSVAWSKRYTADAFGVDTSVANANRQNVRVSVLETGGFLLFVSKAEIDVDTSGGGAATTRTASTIVTRLDSAGAVLWSKVYTVANELDSLVASGPMQDGSIILSGSFTSGSSPSNPITTAVFARLDANGNLSWQKWVEGAFISAMGATADGKVLLGGGQGSGFQFDLVFMVVDVNGNVESQVRIDVSDIDVGFATVSADRVFYNVISRDAPSIDPENPPADNDTAQTAIIGSSSLALNGFTWKQYARPVSSANLGVNRETSNPFFSAFRDDTHRLDAVPLSETLTASGNCALFTDVAVTVQSVNFVFEDVVFNAAAVGVIAADFSPQLLDADIVLDPFVAAEVDVCNEGGNGGGDCAVPVTLTITASRETGTATVGFTSVSGCTHTLQRAETPDSSVWIPVETIPGDGGPYTRQIDLNTQSEYYRVVNEN